MNIIIRHRDEIEGESSRWDSASHPESSLKRQSILQLEVLLDIRDLFVELLNRQEDK